MFDKPAKQHEWLAPLVGEWESVGECSMGPGQETQTMTSRTSCRMIGGLWLIAEGQGDSPEGGPWTTLMTVGFDLKKDRYVGTFLGSMMSYLWHYVGEVDSTGAKLPLDSEGPKFDGTGMTKYRDTIEIVSDDEWLFYGDMLGDDGQWHRLMKTINKRTRS